TIFTARGIRLEPVKWEFLDSSMGRLHKQEEYNREIKDCDICVVLFWQKIGDYTDKELKVADAEMRAGRKPFKIYVFFKEPGDVSQELQEFKASFDEAYGHFYGKFDGVDKLQLDFVMQLERYLHSNLLKVENSQVKIDQVVVANLDNIGFAAGNEKYKSLREALAEIEDDIADLEARDTRTEREEQRLNTKKRKRAELKEELGEHEQLLLDVAVRVAQFAGERISDRMGRAIELFEQGKVSEANAVLDEAERDADEILRGVKELKLVGKQSVDELMIKASYMLADEKYSIDKRIAEAEKLYDKADQLARECDYEVEKYEKLLSEYADFLRKYAKYDKALELEKQLLQIRKKLYGLEHPDTARSYNNIGVVCRDKSDYDMALEYYYKALAIQEKVLGFEHLDTAASYNNIGKVYDDKGVYDKALEFHSKALVIWEKVLGLEHPTTAISYNNIGMVYFDMGNYDMALEYYYKALAIKEKVLGFEHPNTATSYNNIGLACDKKYDYNQALEYHCKALAICEKVLGLAHIHTASSYNNIGLVCGNKGDYDQALEYCHKALVILEKNFGFEHLHTAGTYNNIGCVCNAKGDYDKALKYSRKALTIFDKKLGGHPKTLQIKDNISTITRMLEIQNKIKRKLKL
ncbi:MAG: tetratricopeptide repeat protein, partial [Alistipes sp.]|nr:tetratricopeptide repeat protein [Alistipes sp.]